MSPPRRRWRREPLRVAGELGRYRRIAPEGGETATLQQLWSDIVGKQAAQHSIVVRRSRAGVVSIACRSAAWAQELDARRDEWVRRLAAASGEIAVTGVRFVVGDHVMPAVGAGATKEPVLPTAQELAEAAELTPPIADAALRELLIRACAGQLALARERKRLQKAKIPRRGSRSD